eukprot:Em0001g1868a
MCSSIVSFLLSSSSFSRQGLPWLLHLEQTQEEVLRYKVIVETEKQRKALQAAAESGEGRKVSRRDGRGVIAASCFS